jgi:hypothetical protein
VPIMPSMVGAFGLVRVRITRLIVLVTVWQFRRSRREMSGCPKPDRLRSSDENGHSHPQLHGSSGGGADDPSNMQWETIEEARAKDPGRVDSAEQTLHPRVIWDSTGEYL